jgi:hypothetical protein
MKVVALPGVHMYLEDLAHRLYFNHYFGSMESSRTYVDSLWVEIENNLDRLPRKKAKPHFNRYGKDMFYVTIRKNKHTHWYVFFKKYVVDGETILQVRFIGNNHSTAQYL